MTKIFPGLALAALALTAFAPRAQAGAPELFTQHCASCHGASRLGAMGPALLPASLERLKRKDAVATIRDGRAATQMPAFGAVLSAADIDSLAEWVYSPVTPAPSWSEADIRASRIEPFPAGSLPDARQGDVAKADPMNLFIVVEAGDHHVSVLDGDRMERIFRFPSRYALHGGPKFTPDGRYVFFASRDGWISKFDIWNLKIVAEVRAGINSRNAAVSSDGRYVAVANYLPGNLVIFDADLKLLKVIDGRNLKGDVGSRISAVYDAAPRKSFVVGLKDLPEIWEVSYDPQAKPFFDGYVHDYKMGEAIATPGFLNPRRTELEEPLDDFFFTQSYDNVVGASREGRGRVVNLDVRRPIASLDLPGMPHLGSGISWLRDGHRVVASTNLKDARVSVIDMQNWQTVASIPTLGPGFFLRSHEKSPYAWVDSMMSPTARDTLQVIDKQSLQVVASVRPEPGKTFAHIEFDRYGRYVIASLMEKDGALIFLDANTFKEIKRLPASKPIGKYNLFNKIQRSEGTSH
ncbi:MAG: c-type cytochrome [Zoogloea sp.]|nr:c-type cytochrome [Zoogloea sp.]